MKVIPPHVCERVVSRVAMGPNGCHLSTYATHPQWGYSQLTLACEGGARTFYAHRAAWTYAYGQIPEAMVIDHMCRVRRCIRIDHLRLLPREENARRNWGRDYPLGLSCHQGHDPSERVVIHDGGRSRTTCLACRRQRRRKTGP